MSDKTKEVQKFQDTMYTLTLHGETICKCKLLGLWPMDLVFTSTFHNQSMSIGCVGKLGHLFGFLRHYLLRIHWLQGPNIRSPLQKPQRLISFSKFPSQKFTKLKNKCFENQTILLERDFLLPFYHFACKSKNPNRHDWYIYILYFL